MKRSIVSSLLVGAFLVAGTLTGVSQTEPENTFWFWKLGHMDGPHVSSKALGISRDGKVAVGATDVVSFIHAWRCDIDWAISTDEGVPPLYNELQVQEDLGAVEPSQPSAAFAASDMTGTPVIPQDIESLPTDWYGSLPVGTITVGSVSYGAQWFQTNDFGLAYFGIPDFGGGISAMAVMDVSKDGTVLVGYGNNKRGQVAFRYDRKVLEAPLVVLTIQDPVTSQTLQSSSAQAVSEDGLIIAGYGASKRGNRAFVTAWDGEDLTWVTAVLPMLAGGSFAEAYAMTPDGAVIAGRSGSSKGPQACLWFKDENEQGDLIWVIKGLGGLSKKKLNSVANGVAYRPGCIAGELIVVGKSQTILYPEEAFIWSGNPVLTDDGIGYMYDVEYILTKTVGEASGFGSDWILNEATGISADGSRIVGWGVNPEGGIEAWLITGFPSELVLVDDH
jgi:uncharacterized membrane protein